MVYYVVKVTNWLQISFCNPDETNNYFFKLSLKAVSIRVLYEAFEKNKKSFKKVLSF